MRRFLSLFGVLTLVILVACSGGDGGDPLAPGGTGPMADPVTISGRTLDGNGLPQAGVSISLDSAPVVTTTSAADGSFAFLVEAGNYQATFSVNGALTRSLPVAAAGPDPVDLGDVQVLATVSGTIVGGNQAPLAGATVILDTQPPTSLVTGPSGQFSLQAAPGTYTLSVLVNGLQVASQAVTVAVPGSAELGTLQVLTEVSGLIVNGLLQPVEGAVVTIDTMPETFVVTGGDGRFRADVVAGNYQLGVANEGVTLFQQPFTVVAGTPVNFGALQLYVRAVGRVVNVQGQPVAGSELCINTSPPTLRTSAPDGTFAFDVPAGSFLLSAKLGSIIVTQLPVVATLGAGLLDLGDIVVNPGTDTDLDGLSNELETSGWTILVNENGGDQVTVRTVFSNPNLADTDGDQLTDGEEFAYRTDPSLMDTEGDLISDRDEILSYRSNPNHVDSDGDARALDANGNPVGLPNPSLFDGAELNLSGTSPTLADTDGDGLRDTDEILNGGFSALIADQPLVDIELIGDPLVELNDTQNQTVVSGTIQRQAGTQSRSDARTTQRTTENAQTVSASASVSYPWGGSFSVEGSASWKQGTFNEHSSNFTTSSTNSLQQSLQSSGTTTFSDATIAAAFRVVNQSNLSFQVQDLRILVYRVRPTQGAGALQVIGSLSDSGSTLGSANSGVLLAPQSDFSYVAQNDDLNYQPVLDYLNEPGALLFEVGSYSLKQVDGQGNVTGDYDAIAQSVVERTGLIVIDYGDGNIERYAIATNVRRNPDGSAAGITMEEALNTLGIPFETQLGTAPATPDPSFPSAAGRRVLTKVRDKEVSANVPGEPASAWWVVAGPRTTTTDPGGQESFVDFQDLRLLPGERFTLIYFTDEDRDRLPKREERIFGTSDLTCDTDADQLSDFFEVKVGWDVEFQDCGTGTVQPQYTYRVFSDPRLVDADGDGVTDLNEAPAGLPPFNSLLDQGAFCQPGVSNPGGLGTDPDRADTDGDGLDDLADTCVDAPANPGGTAGLPTQDLWAYYRLSLVDVQAGPQIMDRASPGSNDGNIERFSGIPFIPGSSNSAGNGGTYVFPDRFGRADAAFWFFNDDLCDTYGYVRVPAGGSAFQAPSLSWTWSAWIYPQSAGGNDRIAMAVEDWVKLVQDQQGRLAVQTGFPNSPTWQLRDTNALPALQWTYVALTVDYDTTSNETSVRLYRGALGGSLMFVAEETTGSGVSIGAGTGSIPNPLVNPSSQGSPPLDLTLGHGFDASGSVFDGNGFQGAMDDARFYSRALSIVELDALFNEPPSPGN